MKEPFTSIATEGLNAVEEDTSTSVLTGVPSTEKRRAITLLLPLQAITKEPSGATDIDALA